MNKYINPTILNSCQEFILFITSFINVLKCFTPRLLSSIWLFMYFTVITFHFYFSGAFVSNYLMFLLSRTKVYKNTIINKVWGLLSVEWNQYGTWFWFSEWCVCVGASWVLIRQFYKKRGWIWYWDFFVFYQSCFRQDDLETKRKNRSLFIGG